MTTLFKKLSITTLALAVAGGIVVSVGSSEPSTFEGQASTLFNVLFDGTTSIAGGVATKTGTSSVARKLNVATTGAPAPTTFPITLDSENLSPVNNDGFEILNITSIKVVFTGGGTLTIDYRDKSVGTFDENYEALVSNTAFTAINGADYFRIKATATVTITSILIEYNC
jgi:hypothetical protein